jgi:hypothetical protein
MVVIKMTEKIIGPDYKSLKNFHVFKSLSDNERFLMLLFKKCNDIHIKKLRPYNSCASFLIVYVDELTKKETLENNILAPILSHSNSSKEMWHPDIKYVKNNIITSAEVIEYNTFDSLVLGLLSGKTLLFIDNANTALTISNENDKERAITPPETEQTTRSSRASFVENYRTNVALIRKSIKDPNLCVETVTMGRRNQTSVVIIYINGIISDSIPETIKKRIEILDIDGIIGAAQLEQLIEDNKWTVIPQIIATERVDRVVGSLLEGRAALVLDGTPFVLIVPTTLKLFLSSPDDFFQRPVVGSMLRFIRYLSFFISTSFVSLYVAFTAYQPGMLPTPLALSITGSRVGLPFPVTLEILLLELALYVLQEAAIRLPKMMGPTVGIVGAIIIGQATVQAGIVSPIIVIIVAMSAITSFALPNYTFSLGCIVLRLFMVFMASFLGLFGVVMGWIFILIHLASLENFGIRYLSDYSPYNRVNLKDTLVRISESFVYNRPMNLGLKDTKKQDKKKADDLKDEW